MALSQRYLIRFVFSLLILSTVVAQAQTPGPAEPPVRFRVISMSAVETFFFDIDKTQETLNAGVGSFSRLYPVPRNREVVFYKEVPDSDPAKPPVKAPLAKSRIPAGQPGPFLILLSRNPAGSTLEFSTLVIDQSLTAHTSGTYRVFNFSKRRLAIRLADADMILSTGQSDKVPYPDSRKAWLKVAADEKDDGWLLVSSSPHVVGSNSRTTIFLVDIPPSERDPNPKGIVARRIRETITTDDKGIQHVQ
jgi:hypothetical protein